MVNPFEAFIIPRFIAKTFLIDPRHPNAKDLEYAYAFDVHCNAFLPTFLSTYIAHFFLLYLVTLPGFIPRLISNTLYLIGVSFYIYHTYLGFQGKIILCIWLIYIALGFVKKSVVFVYPLGGLVLVYFVSLLTFNVSQMVLWVYFGQ